MGLESGALAALVGPALGSAVSGIFGQPTGGTGVQGFPGRQGGGKGPPAREMLDSTLMGDILGQQENFLADTMGRLAQPISLAGARVEPLQGYGSTQAGGGGAMPMRVGANAIDPAFRNPQLLVRPGMNLTGLDDWTPPPGGTNPLGQVPAGTGGIKPSNVRRRAAPGEQTDPNAKMMY